SLAEQAEAELAGPDRRAWLDRFEAEHDNLRAALAWSLSGKAEGGRRKDEGDPNPNLHPSGTREAGVFILHPSEAALRLATALWTFWNVRGHWTEGRSWLEGALAASPTAPAARRAPALLRAGMLAFRLADYAAARRLYAECLDVHRATGQRAGI